ncbi:MAG: CD225/dispanin family protein [Pyrinomonadaceae bacterium]
MRPSIETTPGPPLDTRPDRPPNHLVRAIIVALFLLPLGLLIGLSSLYGTWHILTGPPVRSESPAMWRAFMEFLRAVVGLMGAFMSIAAIAKAANVNSEYAAGNYIGAEAASKAAANYTRQNIIILVLILIIMAIDVLRYSTSSGR